MRIVFLTSSMGAGGAERVATTLCNAWVERGDHVTMVATFSGGGAKTFYKLSEEVEFIYLADVARVKSKSALSYIQRICTLRRLVAEKNPDVVISFLPNVNVTALLSFAYLRIPLIICERSDPTSNSYPWLLKLLCKLSYRYADVLTVQTESVMAKVANIFPGLHKVRTIPNPLPESIATMMAKPGSGRKILLSLGRLSPEKQVDKLVAAFSVVAPYFADWDLHIYGDGPLRYQLEKQIMESELRSRAVLKGSTDSPWEAMAGADAFAMVSAYEGFPNALLEAMGVGLPCIVFDCPSGPREITRDGEDALLIPLSDHDGLVSGLAKIMGDETLRRSLGAKARESVICRFKLSQVLEKWDLLFKEVGAMH